MVGIVCNLSLMNYLFLELSIQYFWTVIDWITEPFQKKKVQDELLCCTQRVSALALHRALRLERDSCVLVLGAF